MFKAMTILFALMFYFSLLSAENEAVVNILISFDSKKQEKIYILDNKLRTNNLNELPALCRKLYPSQNIKVSITSGSKLLEETIDSVLNVFRKEKIDVIMFKVPVSIEPGWYDASKREPSNEKQSK